MPILASRKLETIDNPSPGRGYRIRLLCPEFTCLCPMTGHPDFATFIVEYIPNQRCVELKSFKGYLWSFRDEGHFHEAVTNIVLDDLVEALDPLWLRVDARFRVRGGISTTVVAQHGSPS